MTETLTKSSQLEKEAAKWLTSMPKLTPLEKAGEAVMDVAYVVDFPVDLNELFQDLQTILSAMHTSAGGEFPDRLDRVEAPTEEDVENAYINLYVVDRDELLECLAHGLRNAMVVIREWRKRCGYKDNPLVDDV